MPPFAFPAFFLALPLAAAALLAIYWLRNRFQPIRISSLLLWQSQKEARESGVTLHRLQTPLLFFLEILVLAAMAFAAATPLLETTQNKRPYVIILDDSFSMNAGGGSSPRREGQKQIEAELRESISFPVRFLLAGPNPVFLDLPARNHAEALLALQGWRCQAGHADLTAAIALAEETLGGNGRIMVFTDHPPLGTQESGKIRWVSLGRPLPNVAIVNAVRGGAESRERLLLEIANFSSIERSCQITLRGLATDPQTLSMNLRPNDWQRREFEIASSGSILGITLSAGPDDLAIDNEVTLLPRPRPSVKVQISVKNGNLKSLLERALVSTGKILAAVDNPDIIITDDPALIALSPATWLVQFLPHQDALSYTGPFFIDPVHPLTQGLALAGVVWGAGKSELPGHHLLSVGNIPLISEQDTGLGKTVRIKLRPDFSTLHLSPSWPILIFNLIDWRAKHLPGPTQPNLRLFQEASFGVPSDIQTLSGKAPDGQPISLPVYSQTVTFRPESLGLFRFSAPPETYVLAVNPLEPLESNLASAGYGTWGTWMDDASLQNDYRPMTDAVLALALAILALHQLAVYRRPKGIRI